MAECATLQLACELLRRPSITPDDQGCQALIAARLAPHGFHLQSLPSEGVHNLWAVHGSHGPLFVFAGHTDVVPPGPPSAWTYPPFEPTVADGKLFARGAADMKGGLAAMITACESFCGSDPHHGGRVALLLTSDEEVGSGHGTQHVISWLQQQGEQITWAVVGEPASAERLGDEFRRGRRGSLNGHCTVQGRQGHVALPHRAQNPIHALGPAITALVAEVWDEGSAHFPPTGFQISNLHAGEGASNVIPGTAVLDFNFRYSTALDEKTLRRRTKAILDRTLELPCDLAWESVGQPFLTPDGDLIAAVRAAIGQVTGETAVGTTGGGTSDARFIAPTGAQVVEVGPVNRSMHQADEHVLVDDLPRLHQIYLDILRRLLPRTLEAPGADSDAAPQ